MLFSPKPIPGKSYSSNGEHGKEIGEAEVHGIVVLVVPWSPRNVFPSTLERDIIIGLPVARDTTMR